MDLHYSYAIAHQQQLLTDAARLRTSRRPLLGAAREAIARRRAPRPAMSAQPAPCPTC